MVQSHGWHSLPLSPLQHLTVLIVLSAPSSGVSVTPGGAELRALSARLGENKEPIETQVSARGVKQSLEKCGIVDTGQEGDLSLGVREFEGCFYATPCY